MGSGDTGLGVLPFHAPLHPSTLFLDPRPCPLGTYMSAWTWNPQAGPSGGVLEGFSGRHWTGLGLGWADGKAVLSLVELRDVEAEVACPEWGASPLCADLGMVSLRGPWAPHLAGQRSQRLPDFLW